MSSAFAAPLSSALQSLASSERPSGHLFGYRVNERIGIGAGSIVYSVTERATGHRYALKHVTCATAKEKRFVEQLRQEYQVAGTVRHPAFRRPIAFHVHRTMLGRVREAAIVLELIHGKVIHAPMSNIPAAARVVQKLAEALLAMHTGGFVHCDLKPQNVLVDGEARIRLIDFGQACPIGTIKQRIQGTPDFISPEQVQCKPVTSKTDVYGLGAVAYHLLTGAKLTTLFTLQKGDNSFLLDSALPSPAELRRDVPRPMSDLVMECVRTNPSKRPDVETVIKRLEIIRFGLSRGSYERVCA